ARQPAIFKSAVDRDRSGDVRVAATADTERCADADLLGGGEIAEPERACHLERAARRGASSSGATGNGPVPDPATAKTHSGRKGLDEFGGRARSSPARSKVPELFDHEGRVGLAIPKRDRLELPQRFRPLTPRVRLG